MHLSVIGRQGKTTQKISKTERGLGRFRNMKARVKKNTAQEEQDKTLTVLQGWSGKNKAKLGKGNKAQWDKMKQSR